LQSHHDVGDTATPLLLADSFQRRFPDAILIRLSRLVGQVRQLERLEHVLLFYFDFAASNPHLFELMFSAIRSRREESERFMRSSMAAFQRLGEYTEHCIGDGIFVREPYPGSHVLSLWATIHGLSVLANSGHLAARIPPGVSQTTFARTLLRPCLDGLRRNKP
jgi:hypothetical protein